MEHGPGASVPPPPDAARELLGDALPAVRRYAELLAGPAVVRGLIGPREVPRLWDRHLLDSAAVARFPPSASQCADLGSGAGLPGLVVALLRPDLEITLVEPLLRRATFLAEAIDALDLSGRVAVDRARAEDRAGAGYDVVLARAVAPIDRLASWALPMLRPGGELLALKGARAAAELAEAATVLRRLRAGETQIVPLGVATLATPAVVVRVRSRR